MSDPQESRFTVVGYYQDTGKRLIAHVLASSELEAIAEATSEHKAQRCNIWIVAVFHGFLCEIGNALGDQEAAASDILADYVDREKDDPQGRPASSTG